ncbi:helix-turn-helix domain-containing protein [Clostridium estertheticum]|uniref:helix-turn-helix domain-containing protein n=1 Tax=Clostridium estertheticum TaxID=238834 RepID=UPI001C6EE8D4|nr:helix-turn-helix transcriptional regulator [Clostridium estertheticum]MBW9173404.1 helix-turn-helix domain-containing protein [Clostridium estertheticum]WLC76590.1 helix-turn-helix domain-containing protein [Clostridium estertheticum]
MYKFKFKLKSVRKLKCMTQKRLAYLSSLSQSHISELETDKQSPTLKTVENLADALKTHPDKLIEVEEVDTNH